MNKRGANLTMMIVGLLAFVAVIGLAIYANTEFIETTVILPQNDSGEYDASLANISNQDELDALMSPFDPADESGLLKTAYNSAVAIGTTAVIGVGALFTLFALPAFLQTIFNQLATTLNMGQAGVILLWFFTGAASIYIIMKVIQAVRGTNEPA